MPTDPTPRLRLVGPLGTEGLQQGDDIIRALISELEARVPSYEVATGALPAAGVAGRIRYLSDVGISYLDTGTKWRVMGGHIGAMTFSMRKTAPHGFLIAVGQAVTTTHPELRAVLLADNSPFGADASGNPLLPPTPSRALMGSGAGVGTVPLTARAHGDTVGEETHMHGVVAHKHTVDAHTHSGMLAVAKNSGRLLVVDPDDAQMDYSGSVVERMDVGGSVSAVNIGLPAAIAMERSRQTMAASSPGTSAASPPTTRDTTIQPSVALNILVQAL